MIVFKDGHRQTFNLADVARIEFPGPAAFPLPTAQHHPVPFPVAISSANGKWAMDPETTFTSRWTTTAVPGAPFIATTEVGLCEW